MKKIVAFTVLTLCSTSVFASQGFSGRDLQTNDFFSYTENVGVGKVSELKNLHDHAHVILRGSIVKHNGGQHYVFKDAMGATTVNVSIAPSVWKDLHIKNTDMVKIEGFVDLHRDAIEVVVDQIHKVSK